MDALEDWAVRVTEEVLIEFIGAELDSAFRLLMLASRLELLGLEGETGGTAVFVTQEVE